MRLIAIRGFWAALLLIGWPAVALAEDPTTSVPRKPDETAPTGLLGAVLRWDEASITPPEALTVQARATERVDLAKPAQTIVCPLSGDRLLCPLPAGTYDLRLHAKNLVPLYAWAISLEAGQRTELGRLRLSTGGSIIGWVEIPHRDFDATQVNLELVARLASTTGPEERLRLRSQKLQSSVDASGFFQISGVRPGRYSLLAKHPEYAPTRVDDFEVTTGEETELDPFALAEAARLQVAIDPPTSPFGTPWQLRLTRESFESAYHEIISEPVTDSLGAWASEALAPGEVSLQVLDDRGNRWQLQRWELFPGDNYQRVHIPFERLEGTLLLDDEPVVGASVRFSEVRGNTQVRVQSRDEGKFYAFLARDARWDIMVNHPTEGIAAVFNGFEVPEKRRGQRWATQDFELPNTRVFGQVFDGDGDPTSDPVFLDLRGGSPSWSLQRRVDRGRFDLRGLPPGAVRMQARIDRSASERSAKSNPNEVAVRDGSEVGPLRLVLEDSLRLEGLVVSPSGAGVPGAKVLGMPEKLDGQSLDTFMPQAATDADGVFHLEIPARARFVQLTVFAPGFAATQQRLDLATAGPRSLIVPVGHAAGTLIVEYPATSTSWEAHHRAWTTVFWDHGGLSEVLLRHWARLNGSGQRRADQLIVPMLEPGNYQACLGAETVEWLGTSRTPSGALAQTSCDEGFLAPGGRLRLQIPADAVEKVLTANSP